MSAPTTARAVTFVRGRSDAALHWVADARRATYGTALVRIAFGAGAVVFLLANAADRDYLWGRAARWAAPLADDGGFSGPFALYSGGLDGTTLTLAYAALLVTAVLFTLGWHTRWVAPLLLVQWVSLLESNPLVGDQSDNIFRILLLYLCFADLSGRWSLDARRRRRLVARYGAPRPLGRLGTAGLNATLDQLGTLVHNLAVVTACAQICLVYVASGLYKAQGARWQDGTAIYYPMQLSHYRPWPALNDLLAQSTVMVALATWFSVLVQLLFPVLLLWRWTRVAAIGGVLAMHAGIAVVMGLPFFSLFMMAGDCLFVRDATFARGEAWVRSRLRRGDASGTADDAPPAPSRARRPQGAVARR